VRLEGLGQLKNPVTGLWSSASTNYAIVKENCLFDWDLIDVLGDDDMMSCSYSNILQL
jgi:hypothetical protein